MPTKVEQIGDTCVRLIVPSRRKDGGVIDRELRNDWESRARSLLEQEFGGATPSCVQGSYQHPDGRTTREEVVVLTASCFRANLGDEGISERVSEFAAQMCRALGQDSIFLGWGDHSYIIKRDFQYGDVPVVRFTEMSADSQVVHLTMGWAGILSPDKILQVLSLDGWTLPDTAENASASWKLCGVLADRRDRRAWVWTGSNDDVRAAVAAKSAGGPCEGDLIFAGGEPGYLNMYLVASEGLAGPRDLRLSHGQLNPVTRHLLLRVLRREWDLLLEDLRRQPLDQRFFPKLQKLRAAIEAHLLMPTVAADKSVRSLADAGLRKSAKKKTKTAKATEEEEKAFRQSVLIVGRMMFLRFLMQKDWIPAGLEGFRAKARELGDAFFSDWVVPLWFDVLNVPESQRATAVMARFGVGYPYLNGGLFMPRRGEEALVLPAAFFSESKEPSFLRLFDDFEFSLNENDGSDDSLKVDPSFFGRALESFNPDLEKKRYGIHYTPKPIARALAAEAIVARVSALADLPVDKVSSLLGGRRAVSGREASEIRKILSSLRIVDPAVGSGVLLWAALRVLLDLDSACDAVIGGRDGYQPGSFEWGVQSRHFVCNCLYGVDISDEAIELSRLRLWLAVALSEDSPGPLPDLELNICRGDSLLGGKQPKSGVSQRKLAFDDVSRLENDLRNKTRAYVEAGAESPLEQRQLRAEILEIRRRLLLMDQDVDAEPAFNWNLFFPHVFGDPAKQGFDVVIANPPYVRVQQVAPRLMAEYRASWPTVASGSADLSFAFIELALRKLAAPSGGQIAFIQPNFRHHDAGDSVRKLLTGHDRSVPVSLRLWVDFDDAQVFPTASNYVALLFAERETQEGSSRSFTYSVPVPGSWKDPADSTDVSWIRPKAATHQNPVDGEWLTVAWQLRTRVVERMTRSQRRLGDVADIHVGVQTSADDIYLFVRGTPCDGSMIQVSRDADSPEFRLEAAIVKQCAKGSSTEPYWLLFPYDSSGKLLPEEVLAREFPLAWAYLTKHRAALERREKSKFVGNSWYRYGRSQGTEICGRAKIIVPATMRAPVVTIDRGGAIALTASGKGGGGAWAITPKQDSRISLDQLAAALTGDAAWDFFRVYGSPQKGGWRGVDKGVLESLPVV